MPAHEFLARLREKDDTAPAVANRILTLLWGRTRLRQTHVPVDPLIICRASGAEVFVSTMDRDVRAHLVKDIDTPARIYLNRARPVPDQRLDCAHAFGHLVRHAEEETFENVDRDDLAQSWALPAEEIWASEFAAELLMPAERIRQMLAEGIGMVDMAEHRFQVPMEAMRNRLLLLEREGAITLPDGL